MAKLVNEAKEFVADKIAGIQKPEASLADVSIKHASRDSITFHSIVEICNPYSHSIPISEISYSLKSAAREIASGTMPDPGSLKGKEITKVELPLKVPYDFLISIMRDLGKDWDLDYEMRVGLTFDLPVIGNFTLPVSKKGELKLPTLSDVF